MKSYMKKLNYSLPYYTAERLKWKTAQYAEKRSIKPHTSHARHVVPPFVTHAERTELCARRADSTAVPNDTLMYKTVQPSPLFCVCASTFNG